jgi:hypothetical protein
LAEDLQTVADKKISEYKEDSSGWESTDNVKNNQNTEKVR